MNWLDAAPFWERLLFGALGGALTWWSATEAGWAAWTALRLPRERNGPLAAALGYALIGSLVALLGLAHALSVWTFVAGWMLEGAWWLFRARQRHVLTGSSQLLAALRSMPMIDAVAAGAAVFAWLTGAVAATLPATWWDPIAYHLPIAARALAHHAFAPDAGMVQSVFPLLGEAAALPAFAVGGTAGAAMATLGSGIVLALVCGAWAERIAAGCGRLAAALVSCSALWIWLAPSFYVDIPFALFAVAALAIAAGIAGADSFAGWAVASGALAGAAAATKYPGLLVIVLAVCIGVARSPQRQRARSAADIIAASLSIAGAWYVRASLVSGDPLFPFLSTHAAAPIGDFAARYVSMTRSWCGGGTTVADAVALPWRLLTSPRGFCGDPGYALDLGAVFFLISLAAFRRTAVPVAACIAITAAWFFGSQQLRFLVPGVCLFAIAAAVGTSLVSPRLREVSRAALIALCIIGVAVNWLPGPAADASNSVAPAFGYIAGAQSGDDYLSARLEFYDAVRWLRANAPGAPVIALDDVRDYYFGPDARWLNPYYQLSAIDWSATPARRYAPLVSAGYHYLVVNANDAYVRRTPTGVDWTSLRADAQNGWLRARYSANGVTVYELGAGRAQGRA